MTNGSDEIAVQLKIADLAFLMSSMQYAVAETMVSNAGQAVKKRLRGLEKQFIDMCPIGELAMRCAYSWYEGFAALEFCKSYYVLLDKHPVKSYDRDKGLQFALIVDGKRFNLSERFDELSKPDQDGARLEVMTKELLELARRSAGIDAEIASSCEIDVELPYLNPAFNLHRYQAKREYVTQDIQLKLGLTEPDFYVAEFLPGSWESKATIVGSASRISEILATCAPAAHQPGR